jgi:glycosyltransferase involved in cell wall biosynthesis
MRLALVTHRYPPRTGGVETHVRELATRLVDRGHAVTVVSADAGADVPVRSTVEGVRVRRAWALAPGDAVYLAPGVYRAVRDVDADVVHAHNDHALPAVAAAAAAGDRPFVVTPHYHGASADATRDRLLAAYRPIGRRALRRADAVLAVSDWERDRLRADFGVDARVIPNGLDVARFREASPEERDRPYLLTVGRLVAYKGVDRAIRALAEPALDGYDLLVAGSGPDRDAMERTARAAGVADRVTFLGYVDDERLPGLYAGAAAHLLLSEFEAYGMTVAEALAAGTPSVVREGGALAQWAAREGCVGVGEPTPPAVAAAVAAAVDREPSDEGLWTWAEVTDAVADVYRGVLSVGAEPGV